MTRDGFLRGLAAMAAAPDLVLRIRQTGGAALPELPLTDLERHRLITMAKDPSWDLVCTMYRSNRLTALFRTIPEVMTALGQEAIDVAIRFWAEHPRSDLQFIAEASTFCNFVRGLGATPAVERIVAAAQDRLRSLSAGVGDVTRPVESHPA